MTEANSSKSQEDYEDDFEKDLDWLIGEEGQSEQGSDYGDIDAEIDKELEKEETPGEGIGNEDRDKKPDHVEDHEERWPSPMEPLGYDTDKESTSLPAESPSEMYEQTDEEQMYILGKIEQANKELQEQETPDMTRQRRLHFKDTLVDLVVPPLLPDSNSDDTDEEKESALIVGAACVVSGVLSNLIIDSSGQVSIKDRAMVSDAESEVSRKRSELYTSDTEGEVSSEERAKVTDADSEVSRKISELTLSPYDESKEYRRFSVEGLQETKESKVLVEKDGKFDLVSMKDMESQSLLPPIVNNVGSSTQSSAHLQPSFQLGTDKRQAPRPPTVPKVRPSSASQGQKGTQMRNGKRRVQSATGTLSKATFALSSQQKELLQKMNERKERLAREAEQRKREEEELKKQENEQAFKSWLIRKREQIFEERKIHRAKEIERMNAKRDVYDPEEAYRSWLKKKKEQVQRERQVLELRKHEEECNCLMHSRQECDHAFNLWLKRKQDEKRAQQLLALEQSRRLGLEVRRSRRMTELICSVSKNRPFQFTDDSAYRY
ncbi:coiled-coil domain-containing protein 181 isoform X1 [Xiphophorus couchianus]|uniref:coiled-coil domain-containing protein 181 isoform X1 n=1 Tax=Xiphophorus couchianus TaxID=32473 RepID=UPI001016B305|nr:coiled-coil domain-containing protein 181 isoform X1 [Xiphophorus couchianus]XP_027883286.1 coiled-coil domain-containing protein 181 isoform X1 [Xiphophorus couchianus]XP_027883287.1 coiled-coil domain-containing protein 181 isoform X1 [Xiphophorus couchianus]XP_027883288.1 coiled-coil domain-containing protein 181 isoform X1 [Xiphophorus couchianus]